MVGRYEFTGSIPRIKKIKMKLTMWFNDFPSAWPDVCTIHITKHLPGAFDCPFSGNDSNDFIVASFFFSFLLPGRVNTGRFESVQLTLYFVTGINDSRSNPSHQLTRGNSLIVISSKAGPLVCFVHSEISKPIHYLEYDRNSSSICNNGNV